MTKYPVLSQECRYTTLWNVCAQKSPCSRIELNELPCKTQSFETVAKSIRPAMLASFGARTKRYSQWPHREKHRMTDCMQLQQPRRMTSWQNACAHGRQSSHWWHQSASQRWSIIHQFDTSLVDPGHCVNVMLLRAVWGNELFLPITKVRNVKEFF